MVEGKVPRTLSAGQPAHPCKPDLGRRLFAGQARLLAERAERGLRIDRRSVFNLLRVYAIALRDDGYRPA